MLQMDKVAIVSILDDRVKTESDFLRITNLKQSETYRKGNNVRLLSSEIIDPGA